MRDDSNYCWKHVSNGKVDFFEQYLGSWQSQCTDNNKMQKYSLKELPSIREFHANSQQDQTLFSILMISRRIQTSLSKGDEIGMNFCAMNVWIPYFHVIYREFSTFSTVFIHFNHVTNSTRYCEPISEFRIELIISVFSNFSNTWNYGIMGLLCSFAFMKIYTFSFVSAINRFCEMLLGLFFTLPHQHYICRTSGF